MADYGALNPSPFEALHVAPRRHPYKDVIRTAVIGLACAVVLMVAVASLSESVTESKSVPFASLHPQTNDNDGPVDMGTIASLVSRNNKKVPEQVLAHLKDAQEAYSDAKLDHDKLAAFENQPPPQGRDPDSVPLYKPAPTDSDPDSPPVYRSDQDPTQSK